MESYSEGDHRVYIKSSRPVTSYCGATSLKTSSHFPPAGLRRKKSRVAIDVSVVVEAGVHEKRRAMFAVMSFNSIIAKFFPKQALVPFENGMKSSFISSVTS